jgi:ribosome-associated translation inhibitor RaiA
MDRDWTDKRIDDFRDRVDQRFDDVDRRFDAVDRRFDRVDAKFDEFDAKFEKLEGEVKVGFKKVEADAKERSAASDAAIAAVGEKLDKTHRWLMGGLGTIVVAVILKSFGA